MTNIELAEYTMRVLTLGMSIGFVLLLWRQGHLSWSRRDESLAKMVADGDREAIANYLRKRLGDSHAGRR